MSRFNFWIPQNGGWQRTAASHARKTSRSIVYAVWPGRFLIFSDHLALVLALCRGRVESSRLVSGEGLTCQSSGNREN